MSVKYKKGKRIQITTIFGEKVRGKSLGISKGIWNKKIGSEPTLRINKREGIYAIALRNIKKK